MSVSEIKDIRKALITIDQIHLLDMMTFYVIKAQISSHYHQCFVGIFS